MNNHMIKNIPIVGENEVKDMVNMTKDELKTNLMAMHARGFKEGFEAFQNSFKESIKIAEKKGIKFTKDDVIKLVTDMHGGYQH